MFDLDRSIKVWLQQFRKQKAFDDGAIAEMELHIRDHIEDLMAKGHSSKSAFEISIAEFGEVPRMASEEFINHQAKTTLKSLLFRAMLKNYSKTSLRGLMKNPLTSFINVFGLSIAIGICLLVYGFAKWTFSIDQWHENKNEVFLVTGFMDRDGTSEENGLTPRPLAQMLEEEFPKIIKTCRIEDGDVVVKYEEDVFHEWVRYADPSFLEMFTFPMHWGTAGSLMDINSIILSKKISDKYFGDKNPVGRDLQLIFGENNAKVFKVTGVAQEIPTARDIHFDFLINIENIKHSDPTYNFHDWGGFTKATFIQVEKPSDIRSIRGKMLKYVELQNKANSGWEISSFSFVSLADLYVASQHIANDISRGNGENVMATYFLVVISLFMLALACFNYINIAIVSASKRLKEIGVRKSIGASRTTVIVQFLTENIIVTAFALSIGCFLGAYLIIPWFEQMNNFEMEFTFFDPKLWIFLPCLLLFTGLVSGFYPALYISGFQVVKILKGSVKFGKKNFVTKVFLGFQLILACVLITSAVMFTQNTRYVAKRSWGYEKEQVLFALIPDYSSFEKLRAATLQHPQVLSTSGSKDHVGDDVSITVVVRPPNSHFEVDHLTVGPEYFTTLGIALNEGRLFNTLEGSDRGKLVVNEMFVKSLSLNNPIGETVEIDSIKYEVIGVVDDFHCFSFSHEISPTIFSVSEKFQYEYLTLKVKKGTEFEMHEALQKEWAILFPEIPFQGGFQEDVWGQFFTETDSAAQFWRVIAVVGIMLAALGLYGLIRLNISGRIRELSIRKILGANIRQISSVITRQYIALFTLALIIGAPISYYLMKITFEIAYKYHMPITINGVMMAIGILVTVLMVVIAIQLGRVSKSNPVDGLKAE